MNTDKPIKRATELRSLSRDHHHALLLCWKIKTGFSKGISPQRMKTYADWFWKQYLSPHFETEEKFIFPVLGDENKYVSQAIVEHRKLAALFMNTSELENSLKQIQTDLENHIRFEERILFNEIQNAATPEQLEAIRQHTPEEKFADNNSDMFWV